MNGFEEIAIGTKFKYLGTSANKLFKMQEGDVCTFDGVHQFPWHDYPDLRVRILFDGTECWGKPESFREHFTFA